MVPVASALLCFLLVRTLSASVIGHDDNVNGSKLKHAEIDSSRAEDPAPIRKEAAEPLLTSAVDLNDVPQEHHADDPFDPKSTTITNNVQWKDNNENPLQIGRGGKLAKISGVWYWIGSQSSTKGNWVSSIELFC